MSIKTRADLDAVFAGLEPELRKRYALRRIGYFGSFARNEQREDSDIDVIYEIDDSLDTYEFRAELAGILGRAFQRKIDVVPQDKIKKQYASGIMEDARYVENGEFYGGHDFSNDPLKKVHRMKRQDVYLDEMLAAIAEIEEFVEGLTYDEYQRSRIHIRAVERNVAIVGEASKKLSKEIKAKNAVIPWLDWANFRNYLIHEYFQDFTERVWDIVQTKIIPAKEEIKRIAETERIL